MRERSDGTVRADWAPYIGDGQTSESGFHRKTSTGGSAARPAPFTNIAWRIWHLAGAYGNPNHPHALLGRRAEGPAMSPRHEAAAALDHLTTAHAHWRAALGALADEQLGEPVTDARDPRRTKLGYVMYFIDEFTHHGAELGVLRDLYAHTNRADPLDADPLNIAELAWAGMWHLMPSLIGPGIDPDAESRGVRALHLAAAAGEDHIVELLLERGADPNARCPLPEVWGGTPSEKWPGEVPAQWAEHFNRTNTMALLREHL